ncbi:response regulator [Bradyrhizobium sp. STM 3557]|uniref:response regulator n=1 Tax=Bradyrhizobium sp. STM 3557 TaxID=578920 RepID=UPI00388D747F
MTRILVVDDEIGVCCVIQHLLAKHGYAVTAMTDGRAAREAVACGDYAAALIDLNLANIDGNEVIRAARAAKPEMPIVMMSGMVLESGRGAPDLLDMPVKVQDVHHLPKPFKPKDLLQLISDIIPREDIPQRTDLAAARRNHGSLSAT